MRIIILTLLSLSLIFPQSDSESGYESVSDPDEQHHINTLLTSLFHPFNLETADSIQLSSKGFSSSAVDLLLEWQKNGNDIKQLRQLRKRLDKDDLALLNGTVQSKRNTSGLMFRQRLQYSVSLQGWRIVNKGRIKNGLGSLVFLFEQDPGEYAIADHSILTLSLDHLPNMQRLIIGDFHVSWGGGLLLNQKGNRPGLNPTSLVRQSRLTLTPHYSTRETNYFHGFAAEWDNHRSQAIAFLSRRSTRGSLQAGIFHEDSDGIHPSGKSFELKAYDNFGFAATTQLSQFQFYLGVLANEETRWKNGVELGIQLDLNPAQLFQIFIDSLSFRGSRSIVNWKYKSKTIEFAAQHRLISSQNSGSENSILFLLGSRAPSERGLSLRLQLKPRKQLKLLYSLDIAKSADVLSLSDIRQIIWHKAQVIHKVKHRVWQFDANVKVDGPQMSDEVWGSNIQHIKISKFAISLSENLSPMLRYRINLKTGFSEEQYSVLIQQRIVAYYDLLKVAIGYARYVVPLHDLRLSIYESGLAESFNFFTAYDDGQRWFIYIKYHNNDRVETEFRVVQSQSFQVPETAKQVGVAFQLSVVL